MLTTDQVQAIQHTVSEAKSILVVYSPEATIDQVASAVALFKGLQTLDSKSVMLLSPEKPNQERSILQGIQETSSELGNKNLEISFDYQDDMVDKVSYNIDEEAKKFHLIIQPAKGAKPLDEKTVEFSYTGTDADVIFLLGVSDLSDLEQLYTGFEAVYEDARTISIHSYETTFGSIKISTVGAASTSEVIAYLLQELGVEFSGEIATNLITGIESATDRLQSLATTADTFEIISKLLRAGGRRVSRSKPRAQDGFAHAISKVSKGEASKAEVKESHRQAEHEVHHKKAE
ncbi:hypothetical protein BH10PAT2_BH10PAT2_0080 [soil metagenome]